ncbi:MAG: hypothetical protein JSV33_05310 [bacterium]|nr:MAG: hypothetical protein JSV33_05310 [bacterium]
MLVKILRYLWEVDRRRLYLPRGYSSLFEFCTGYLKYSRSAAGKRIRAARHLARFPKVAGILLSGEIDLCVLSLVSGILTRENAGETLSWIKGRSFREVELLVSRHRPERMLRDRVKPVCIIQECADGITKVGTGPDRDKKLPGETATGIGTKRKASLTFTPNVGTKCKAGLTSDFNIKGGLPEAVESSNDGETPGMGGQADTPANASSKNRIEQVLITQKFKLEFAVDPGFMEKLARVKSLLSSKYPNG